MTDSLPPRVRAMLQDSGALLSGHFILTSGRHSGNYLQCALLCAVPAYCEELAGELAKKIRAQLREQPCDLVLAPALGGVVIGYEVARQLGVRGLFTERDKEGAMCLRRGFQIRVGERVLIVEDVVTTGGSVLEVAKIVEANSAKVAGLACLFNRSTGAFQPGPPVLALADLSFPTYPASECPLCKEGKAPAIKPGSRK